MNAGNIMNRNLVVTGPECTLITASELMAHHRVGALPVVERDGRVLGVLTATDVVSAHARELPPVEPETVGPEPYEPTAPADAAYWYHLGLAEARRRLAERAEPGALELLVSDVYSPGAIAVSPETPLAEMARLMSHHRIHHVVVLEEGRLAGIVSALDLVACRSAWQRHTAKEAAAGTDPARLLL